MELIKFHPFSIAAKSVGRVVGGLEPIPAVIGRVHPGQVASPSQGHTETNETNNRARSHSFLRTILESLISLTCMFLDGGRKPEYPERLIKLIKCNFIDFFY